MSTHIRPRIGTASSPVRPNTAISICSIRRVTPSPESLTDALTSGFASQSTPQRPRSHGGEFARLEPHTSGNILRPKVPTFDLPPTLTPTINPNELNLPFRGHGLRRQAAPTRSGSPRKQFHQGLLSPSPVPQYSPPPVPATEMRPDTPSPMTSEQLNSRFTPMGTPTGPDPVRTVAEVKFPHLKGKELYHAVSEYLRKQYQEDDEWMEEELKQQKEALQRSVEVEKEQRHFAAMYKDSFPGIDLRKLIRTRYSDLRGDALLAAVEKSMEGEGYGEQCEEEAEPKKPKYRSIRATPAHERMAYRSSTPCPAFVFPFPEGEELESMEMETFDRPLKGEHEAGHGLLLSIDGYPADTSESYPAQMLNTHVDEDAEPLSSIHDFGPRPVLSYNSLSSRNRHNLSIVVPPVTHPTFGTELDVSPKIAVRETIAESPGSARSDHMPKVMPEMDRYEYKEMLKLAERQAALSILTGDDRTGSLRAMRVREAVSLPVPEREASPPPPPIRHIQGLSEATKKRLARERKERLKAEEKKMRKMEDNEAKTRCRCGCAVM